MGDVWSQLCASGEGRTFAFAFDSTRNFSLCARRTWIESREAAKDDVAAKIRVSASVDDHRRWLDDYVELGVDRVFCFNVCQNQREYIDTFGPVLPAR